MVARKCQKMKANAKSGQGQIAERDIKECGRPRPPGLNEVGEGTHAPWFFGITPPSNFFQKSATPFLPLPLSGFFPAPLRLCARYLYVLTPYCATLRLPPWATPLTRSLPLS